MRRLKDAAKYNESKVFTEILELIGLKDLSHDEK